MTKTFDDALAALINSPIRETPAQPPANYQPTHIEACRKCGGTGWWRPGYRCFSCKGNGHLEFKTSASERERNRAGAAERKARTEAQRLEDFQREQPEIWAWIDGNTFGFAVAMREALAKYGSLTERQLLACLNCIAKRDAARAAAGERIATAKPVDMTKIEAAFARAGAVLKRPKLRVQGFTIYPAKPNSKNPGALYVRIGEREDSTYLGKIFGGRFTRSRDCTPEIETRLLEVTADLSKAAVSYGRLTGNCTCCGKLLFHPDSVARGIGPICAAKFGWGLAEFAAARSPDDDEAIMQQMEVEADRAGTICDEKRKHEARRAMEHDGTEDYEALARREARR